jgi:hypothetical protein
MKLRSGFVSNSSSSSFMIYGIEVPVGVFEKTSGFSDNDEDTGDALYNFIEKFCNDYGLTFVSTEGDTYYVGLGEMWEESEGGGVRILDLDIENPIPNHNILIAAKELSIIRPELKIFYGTINH